MRFVERFRRTREDYEEGTGTTSRASLCLLSHEQVLHWMWLGLAVA